MKSIHFLLALGAISFTSVVVASPVDVPINWDERLTSAAQDPNRFALNQPVQFDSRTDGVWNDGVWRLTIRIPEAASASARLALSGFNGHSVLHVAGERLTRDMGHYLTVPVAGETISLTLEAAEGERPRVQISEVFGGFRDMRSMAPAPVFKSGMHDFLDCSPINYTCERQSNPQLDPLARASVHITVNNQILCSGTLLNNNASGEPRALLYTAGHCQFQPEPVGPGEGSGFDGLPNSEDGDEILSAETLRVYFLYEDDCDDPEALMFSGRLTSLSQFGAQHLFQFQDHWLVELNEFPVAEAHAYLAGFTLNAPDRGEPVHMIHHASGLARQYTQGETLDNTGFPEDIYSYMFLRRGTVQSGSSGSGFAKDPSLHIYGVTSAGNFCDPNDPDPSGFVIAEKLVNAWNAGMSAFLDDGSGAQTVSGREAPWASTPAPELVSGSVSPAELRVPGNYSAQWETDHADACTARDGSTVIGTGTSGNITVEAAGAPREAVISLTCTGAGGESTFSLGTVSILPPQVVLSGVALNVLESEAPGAFRLDYTSEHAQQCESTLNGSTEGVGLSGPLTRSGLAAGDYSLTLHCFRTDESGNAATREFTFSVQEPQDPDPDPDVHLSFQADRTLITEGESVTFTWSTEHADACQSSGAWSGPRPLNGTATVTPPVGDSTFVLTCTGPGQSNSRSISVRVEPSSNGGPGAPVIPAPSITQFDASDAQVPSGGSVTLTWDSMDAEGCEASGDWSGALPASGVAQQTGLAQGTRVFTLTCRNSEGVADQTSVSVTVLPPPGSGNPPPGSGNPPPAGNEGGGDSGGSFGWWILLGLPLAWLRSSSCRSRTELETNAVVA